MAVAKKNKRNIVVDGTTYAWFVRDDCEHSAVCAQFTLLIMSDNKEFFVHYPLHQQGERNFLVVLGKVFGGNGEFGGQWQRVACPEFETGAAVTPQVVRNIVVWALQDKANVFVDHLGKIDEK